MIFDSLLVQSYPVKLGDHCFYRVWAIMRNAKRANRQAVRRRQTDRQRDRQRLPLYSAVFRVSSLFWVEELIVFNDRVIVDMAK